MPAKSVPTKSTVQNGVEDEGECEYLEYAAPPAARLRHAQSNAQITPLIVRGPLCDSRCDYGHCNRTHAVQRRRWRGRRAREIGFKKSTTKLSIQIDARITAQFVRGRRRGEAHQQSTMNVPDERVCSKLSVRSRFYRTSQMPSTPTKSNPSTYALWCPMDSTLSSLQIETRSPKYRALARATRTPSKLPTYALWNRHSARLKRNAQLIFAARR